MSGTLIFNNEYGVAGDALRRLVVSPDTADDANLSMDISEGIMDRTGMTDASENLRRYRSGIGTPHAYSSEEMDRYPEFG